MAVTTLSNIITMISVICFIDHNEHVVSPATCLHTVKWDFLLFYANKKKKKKCRVCLVISAHQIIETLAGNAIVQPNARSHHSYCSYLLADVIYNVQSVCAHKGESQINEQRCTLVQTFSDGS